MKMQTIRHNESAPAVAQAAQIALVLMGCAKAASWAEVEANADALRKVELTARQQRLLAEHRGILPYLRRGGRGAVLRTLFACPECERFAFTAGPGSAPSRCPMTLGCPGAPVKAKSTRERESVPAAA